MTVHIILHMTIDIHVLGNAYRTYCSVKKIAYDLNYDKLYTSYLCVQRPVCNYINQNVNSSYL